MNLRKLGKSKAKASLARANNVQVVIEGAYEDDRQKFQSLYSYLGTSYSGNSVTDMVLDNRVEALEDRDVQLFNGDTMVVADLTVANTTTETEIFASTIPAGFITTPTMMELELDGVYSTDNASDTFTVRIKLNGSVVHSFMSVPKNVTNTPVEIAGKTTIRTIGVSGTMTTKATFSAYNDSLFGASVNTGSVDTTVDNTISVTMQWSSANTNNTGTVRQGIVKMNKNQG